MFADVLCVKHGRPRFWAAPIWSVQARRAMPTSPLCMRLTRTRITFVLSSNLHDPSRRVPTANYLELSPRESVAVSGEPLSTGDQHIETQLYDLREMARLRGCEIVCEYADQVSGAKSKRPGLDKHVRRSKKSL